MEILDQLVTEFESLKERSKSFVELYLSCMKSDQAQQAESHADVNAGVEREAKRETVKS